MKGITETLKNDIKKGGALLLIPMLLGTLGVSLLTGRGMYRAGNHGQGLFRAGQGIKKKSLILFHPVTNFEIQNYFKNERRFNDVYSRNNLTNLKNGAYVINLGHSKNAGTHWVVIFVKKHKVIYFDSLVLNIFLKKYWKK